MEGIKLPSIGEYLRANAINEMLALGFDEFTTNMTLHNYTTPDRHYHSMVHINEMIAYAKMFDGVINQSEYNTLMYAILMHDVIYDVTAKDNEEKSLKMATEVLKSNSTEHQIDSTLLKSLIMATKDHQADHPNEVCRIIIEADLMRFANPNFKAVWNHTMNIYKEYSFVDIDVFIKGRIEFLEDYKYKIRDVLKSQVAYDNVEKLIIGLSIWEPKVAIYAGSFNPLHIGHMNIIEKATGTFDKVIIARGQNPDKKDNSYEIPDSIKKRYQCVEYDGLLTDYLSDIKRPVTLIRGLRSTFDLQAEIAQYRVLQDLMPHINVMFIVCDGEYDYISSSMVRTLEKYNKEENYLAK